MTDEDRDEARASAREGNSVLWDLARIRAEFLDGWPAEFEHSHMLLDALMEAFGDPLSRRVGNDVADVDEALSEFEPDDWPTAALLSVLTITRTSADVLPRLAHCASRVRATVERRVGQAEARGLLFGLVPGIDTP